MIGSNAVRCEVRNKDQYGRNVSSCSVLTNKGPMDIGNFMVSNGYAVAYRWLYSFAGTPSIAWQTFTASAKLDCKRVCFWMQQRHFCKQPYMHAGSTARNT